MSGRDVPRPGWSGRRRAIVVEAIKYLSAALAIVVIVWAAIVLFLTDLA